MKRKKLFLLGAVLTLFAGINTVNVSAKDYSLYSPMDREPCISYPCLRIEGLYDDDEVINKYKDSEGNIYELYINKDVGGSNRINNQKLYKEIVIPDDIKKVASMYYRCEKVVIPKSVSNIVNFDFNKTAEFVIDEENQSFCAVDGVAYTKDMKVMIGYPKYKEAEVYKVPDSVEYMLTRWESASPKAKYIIYPINLKDATHIASTDIKSIYAPSDDVAEVILEKNTSFSDSVNNHYLDIIQNWEVERLTEPLVVYLPKDSKYIDVLQNEQACVVIDGENYTLSHVMEALKMSVGIYETQPDLSAYENGNQEKLLFDENEDGNVGLDDVLNILEKVLGITEKPPVTETPDTPSDDVTLSDADYFAINKKVIEALPSYQEKRGYVAITNFVGLDDSQIAILIEQLNENEDEKTFKHITMEEMWEIGAIQGDMGWYNFLTGNILYVSSIEKDENIITVRASRMIGYLDGQIYEIQFEFIDNEWQIIKNEIIGYS